jgi:glycosyltransferase involved in cell wall biosynthesis
MIDAGIDIRRITEIYNAVDEERFNGRMPEEKGEFETIYARITEYKKRENIILFFPSKVFNQTGNFSEIKQFSTVLDGIIELKRTHTNFILLFFGPQGTPGFNKEMQQRYQGLLARIQKEELSENVYIVPSHVRPEEMPLFYALADVVCSPSLAESFGLVFAEAALMAKPVVAAKTGAAPEIIQDGESGYLIQPKDSKELAMKLHSLIEHDGLRESMGIRGRAYALKKFTFSRFMKEIEDLYASFHPQK